MLGTLLPPLTAEIAGAVDVETERGRVWGKSTSVRTRNDGIL